MDIKTVTIQFTYDADRTGFLGDIEEEVDSFFEGLSLQGIAYDCHEVTFKPATEEAKQDYLNYMADAGYDEDNT